MTRPLSPPRPVIVKTCRAKAVCVGLLCLGMAIAVGVRMKLGLPEGLGWVLEPLILLFMAGISAHLFGIAIFRPVALRMDEHGISGYYVPPLTWDDVAEITPFKEHIDNGPFYTRHVAIKAARTGPLYQTLSRRKYDRALRLQQRHGFHFLIPQLLLKDMRAADVEYHARTFQTFAAGLAKHADDKAA